MNIKSQEIIFKNPRAAKIDSGAAQTYCEIFNFEPENMEQIPLGNLYMVAQLTLIKDCKHLGNLLASLIKREYYFHPQNGAQKCFQLTLRKANSYLKDFNKDSPAEWFGKLNFVCAVAAGQELFLAQAGGARVFLCRQNRLTDLSRKIIPEANKSSPSKIFSSVVAGKIEAGDKILFTTPTINDYFSPGGLRQILIVSEQAEVIADQIEKVMREAEKPFPLAAVILKFEREDPLPQAISQTQRSQRMTTPPIKLDEIFN